MAQQREAPPRHEERRAMTYEESLTWVEAHEQTEWVNGEGIKFVPGDPVHANATDFLFRLLADFVEEFDLGGVFHSPLEMHLEMVSSSREPDVLFVAREHMDRIGPKRIEGPVDLAIEVISPDSVRRDRVAKLAEYAAAGIPEYWIFDVRTGKVRSQFYQLNERGQYEEVELDAEGRYFSAMVPGFWLKSAWLRQNPLPKARPLFNIIARNAR